MDPKPENNVILTQSEGLMLNGRPKNPAHARNKNVLVVGGSGSGKTRFFIKPNLMQMHSSYVVTDPKGTVLVECGKMLQRGTPKLDKDGKPVRNAKGKIVYEPYKIRVFNTINFQKSMHFNPFAYIHSEKDILKIVTTLIANTKGEGKAGDDFWVKAETLLYTALIGYIYYEAPTNEQNFATLVEMLNAMEVREDDESFKNAVDLLFDALEQKDPDHFALRQYKKYKLAAGKTAKSILISCASRLAPFDIREVREITMYDELDLDMLGDERTALFLIMSDTDGTFAFLISLIYSILFNRLCERADDVYGGRLPVHVRCLIDEAANIGQIPNLERLMATIRSREISACLVLQAQSQLKALYKDNMDTIIGNCDASLFLGGKEETTLKSWNSLLGKETIDLYNTSVTKGNQESHGQNFQKLGKDLMSVDELAVMDGGKCLLQIRGVRPFLSRKYDITKHPNYIVERPEADAVFEVYLKAAGSYENAKESERDLLTTDGDGFAASKMLPYGRYTVHQTAGEEGKALIPDFTVFISSNGQTYSYILNNRTITARLKVEKCDAETGNIIPVPGTGFQVKDLSTGEFVTQEIYYPNPETLDTFYVSDEGWLMLPEPLHTGDYELYEVAAPYGYVLSSEPVPFTIDGSESVVTVTQHNMPQKGQLTITKTGEVFASVQENDGLYQPVYEVMGLPGAVYDVIADEDIYTGDGTLRAAKDTVVETLTTGEDGTAASGLLYLGRYRLEERQAPAGMVLNSQPEYAELTYAGETVEVTQIVVGLYDERQKVAVSLSKELETDELFGLGMNEEYKDISFGLYASADLTALDGSVIPAGGLLEVVSVDPDEAGGYDASFASDLPFGSYYVKERTTNSAYILSDTEYPVVFEYAGQDAALVQILVNEGEPISNDLLRGRVDGVKVGENPEGGDDVKLSGALIGLFQPDTEEFTEENALLTVTTGEDGSFAFENIPYGHWIVKEISAPALYTVSQEQHHIYIGVDGQSIEIRVENTLIRGSVQVMKTEAVDEPSPVEKENEDKNTFLRFLSGAVFDLYEDTNGSKELDSEDKKLGTLKEADAGYHTAENLLAGGYFIKESKAPEGYQLDENAYYFEITEDGQTVVVENGEAGRGFTNEAYRGNLKITKDSSDGRKDGFAFEVKSADGSYCETFTTPKSGVIEVTGLRVGIYTVTEINNRASKDYIIPDAATVEIKAEETATVQFFNEKPEKPEEPKNPDNPKTPDNPSNPSTPSNPGKPVPQTGDDAFIFLYGCLLALAVIGGGVFTVFYFKKGKYEKTSPKKKAVGITVVSLCVLLAFGSGFLMVRDLNQYTKSAGAYDELAENVELPEPAEASEETAGGAETDGEDSGVILPVVDFEALKKNGPDIIGWITLPDSAINYPVTQTDNNEYYLRHLYDGTYNKAGCLFADYENQADFSDRNTIIYGHNMRDGSMFAVLNQYDGQPYFDTHRQMYLVTPTGGYVMEIFSAFAAKPAESGSDTSPWRLNWKDDGAYTTWLRAMAERSVVETDVSVTSSDKVLTLSTCTPGGASRFIVMGKLVEVQ